MSATPQTEAQRLAEFKDLEYWPAGVGLTDWVESVCAEMLRLDAALADELNNRDVMDKMLTQCITERDQLRAQLALAVAKEREECGWQPIETAPKDGSDCWLLVEEEVRRGFWVEIEFEERRDLAGRYIDQTDDDAYWMDKDSGDSLEPTMFYPITKPLPPAPAIRKGQL